MNKLEFTRFQSLDYACKEAMNTLCTNLTFTRDGTKIIMLTGCQAHEGKSFLAVNMLRTLAELGKKVVLVDADLRRSQIKAKYGIRIVEGEGRSLTHYLAGMNTLEEVIYATDLPRAYMIPVGHEVSNSLALLNTKRLQQLLQRLTVDFDFVLVDAPPVGVIIDAAEIAKFCDGAIFVVKYNSTSRRDLAEAKYQIEQSGCQILGAVLNEVTFESLSNKKYYNKTYYSHYNTEYSVSSDKKPKKKPVKK